MSRERSEFLCLLGEPIEDAYEEAITLSSHAPPSRPLGIHAPRATSVTVSINKYTLTLSQSPSLLNSKHASGTTGAMLWSITPHVARYLTSPTCALPISSSSRILELGCGAAAVLACTLGPMVHTYIQSDIPAIVKLAEKNVSANLPGVVGKKRGGVVHTIPLDWERDDVATQPVLKALGAPLDWVVACDCVYNEALVPPLVETLASACRMNRDGVEGKTMVLVAQELRSPDVLEEFLEAFMDAFTVWRVPDRLLSNELREGNGYVLHVGVLKD